MNLVAPIKTVRIKNNTRKWFDGEIAEEIYKRDKLHKKFKLTKLPVDEDLYKETRNAVQHLIRKKKTAYFEEKLKANTANPKKLWETLKEQGLQKKPDHLPPIFVSKRKMVWHLILLLYLKFSKNSIPILLTNLASIL